MVYFKIFCRHCAASYSKTTNNQLQKVIGWPPGLPPRPTEFQLYLKKPITGNEKPKKVIPLIRVSEAKPNKDAAKYAFQLKTRGAVHQEMNFDCENAANLKAWLAAIEEHRAYAKKTMPMLPPRSRSHSKVQRPVGGKVDEGAEGAE